MKRQILISVILIFQTFYITADPLLVAVLMVKNEAPVMQATLQPLVDAGITDFLIYDTGSTDDTIKTTQDFFIDNSITNFAIESGEWVDFATSRNHALELTEQHFPNATFMLMLDAEWILRNGTDLLKFCKEEKNATLRLYCIKLIGSDDITFYHSRLIRCRSNIAFVGKIHEDPGIAPQKKVPASVFFKFNPTQQGQAKTETRWLKDRDVLLKEIEKNPSNERAVFFLAQTCFALKDVKNSIKWYEIRKKMSGYDEENFLTLLFLAQSYQADNNTENMIYNYLKAFCMRPHRAEPLIRLAEYYYKTQSYNLCYLFAQYACTLPYPEQDISLVDNNLYDFTRYALLSGTAYIVNDFKLGREATLNALKARPDAYYLQNNLKYYQSMLDQN